MNLTALQAQFEAGELTKAEFIAQANHLHQQLFALIPPLIKSEVHQILIDGEGIRYVMGDEAVALWCPANEARVAPLETLNFGAYEPEESALMNRLAAGSKCILDIGANIGYHALRLAQRELTATVHAFEPLPQSFEFLSRNVALNALGERVRCYAHGLSNANGSFEFFIAPENGTNASLRNVAGRSDARCITGLALTLDSWTANTGATPDFIKCDVEGAELLVFQGGRELLGQHKPRVFTELLRKWSAPFGYHPNDVIAFFAELGYGCWGVGEYGLREIESVTDETVETNYAFLHHEAHAALIAELLDAE